MKKQAPNSSFTKECGFATIADMQNQDAEVRRTNLKRLIERDFGGNISRAAREYGAGQNYLSALLKDGKSFGEKTARKIEDKLGLLDRQLDIPQSPLAHDHSRRDRTNDELHLVIAELSMDDKKELLAHGRRLRAKNRLRPTG